MVTKMEELKLISACVKQYIDYGWLPSIEDFSDEEFNEFFEEVYNAHKSKFSNEKTYENAINHQYEYYRSDSEWFIETCDDCDEDEDE